MPYETLPGGTTNLYAESGDCSEAKFPASFFLKTGIYNGPICFVPSYSALDVQTVTPATAAVAYLYGVPPQTSAVPRVASFIAIEQAGGTYNQKHLQFTPRNSQWIFNALQGTSNATLNCQSECNPYPVVPITDPDIICASGTGTTFTVYPPLGGVTDWTVSPAGLATFTTPTAGATSVTLVPAASTSKGVVTLTANLSNGCFSTTATRRVAVGEGFLVINDGVGPDRCPERSIPFAITAGFGAQGAYTWQVSHGRISTGQGTDRITVSGLPDQDYYLQVSVSAAAFCAGATPLTQTYSQHIYPTAPGGIGMCDKSRTPTSRPAAYPNPADQTLTLTLTAPDDPAAATGPRTAALYNAQGREVRRNRPGTSELSTAGLPAGLYYLRVEQNGRVTRSQIQVQH